MRRFLDHEGNKAYIEYLDDGKETIHWVSNGAGRGVTTKAKLEKFLEGKEYGKEKR